MNSNLSIFARVCNSIAEELAEPSGFIAIPKLLSRFNAGISVRPLLVEGMLATIERSSDSGARVGWMVLLDSESSRTDEAQIMAESGKQPLPARIRFTVAHELVHSLAFRPDAFGLKIDGFDGSRKSVAALVKSIERETDRITSRLLFPQSVIRKYLSEPANDFSPESLQVLIKSLGISRFACLSRLSAFLAEEDDGLMRSAKNINVGIGIGEWNAQGLPVLRKFPLFLNFENNLIPECLLKVSVQDQIPAATVFHDESFVLCGGESTSVRMSTVGGTARVPDSERMEIQISAEQTSRKRESSFFYVVKRLKRTSV